MPSKNPDNYFYSGQRIRVRADPTFVASYCNKNFIFEGETRKDHRPNGYTMKGENISSLQAFYERWFHIMGKSGHPASAWQMCEKETAQNSNIWIHCKSNNPIFFEDDDDDSDCEEHCNQPFEKPCVEHINKDNNCDSFDYELTMLYLHLVHKRIQSICESILDIEIWKPYRNTIYLVSNKGYVKNRKTGQIIARPSKTNTNGYLRFAKTSVHRAVAELFCENQNPNIYKVVDHKDGNKQNNNACNLVWSTQQQNMQNPHTKEKIRRSTRIRECIYRIHMQTGIETIEETNAKHQLPRLIAKYYYNRLYNKSHTTKRKTEKKQYIFLFESELKFKEKCIQWAKSVER